MTLAFDIPACASSPLQRLDPRWKLAGLLPLALSFVLVQTWAPALVALAGSMTLVAVAGLPPRWYVQRLAAAMAMFALFFLWLPFVPEDQQEALDIGIASLSLTGLLRLVTLTAKLAAMLSVMLVLLATAPLHDTFKAAHALRMPGLLIHLMLLTYRYVFLLTDEFTRLRTALRVRGFRNRPDLHSYRTVGQVAGTLLVRSHERSERVAQAMRARGFDGQFRSLHDFRTARRDVLATGLCLAFAAALLAWDFTLR